MIVLGAWAVAIGLADWIASTERRSGRTAAATVALPVASALAGAGLGLSAGDVLVLVVVTWLSGALWLWLWHVRMERAALVALALAFVGLLVLSGGGTVQDAPFAGWAETGVVHADDPARVVLVVGFALLLVSTSNRVVRIVLNQVERGLLGQEEQLRGGRVIGPLERLLIYGLGISGQLIAAGLVVAAKSLLRFSEVRGRTEHTDPQVPRRAELMSEYLLVGSLLSWLLALIAVGVVRG